MKHLLSSLLLGLSVSIAATVWAAPPIRLGVLAVRPANQAMLQWQPLADYLEKTLKQPVKLSVYGFPELENAVASKQLDVVLTNPSHFIMLRHRFDLSSPLATLIIKEGDTPLSSFGGTIFARADDNRINELRDLKNMRAAATSADSLGGYQMQSFEMLEAGIAPPQGKQLLVTGMPHDRAVEAVLSKRADIGFMRSGILEAMIREGKLDPKRIKILHRQKLPDYPYASSTRLYPEWPISSMPHISEPQARSLAVALLSMPHNSPAASAAGIHGFTLPANYGDVEDVLRYLHIPPFDKTPELTLGELWQKYAIAISAVLGLLSLTFAAMGIRLLAQKRQVQLEQQRFATLFESAPEAMWIIANKQLFDCNQAAVEIFGYANKQALLTLSLSDFSPENQPDGEDSGNKLQHYMDAASAGIPQRFEWRYLRADGREFTALISLLASTLNGMPVLIASGNDITDRKAAQEHLQQHNRILQMLTTQAPLPDMLEAIARDVETLNPAMLCSILLVDTDGLHLRHAAGPSLPKFFNRAVDGIAIGPEGGSCGITAHSGQAVIIEDVEKHPACLPFLPIANLADIRASWSQPILSGHGKVLGTLSIFLRHVCAPSVRELQFLEDEARLAALAIEKSAIDNRLQLAASVFSHAREAIMITDAEGLLVDVNDTFTSITGYSREEAIGHSPKLIRSNRHPSDVYVAMWKSLLDSGSWHGEIWNCKKNGDQFAAMLTISAVKNDNGTTRNYVALFTDITPMKEHQHQLERIAHYDALTGLPNRVLLADRLSRAIINSNRRKSPLAVAFLDLDGFKAINDHHGHDVGDQLLVTLAQRLASTLRMSDTLARIGGDEFVTVLVDLENPKDYEQVLNRMLEAASQPVLINDELLQVSASIGVTLYPQDNVDADLLMRHADHAMYIAKQAGKNRYHLFDVEHDTAVQTQRESVDSIRKGMDKDQFTLFYQPKVNMRTGAVTGAEALIRWRHPERGLLPPAEFLPLIEGDPINLELGEWVIHSALHQLEEWHSDGFNIPISINIAAEQLQDEEFIAHLSKLLHQHPQVRPGDLELEILETSALEDIAQVSSVMHACRELGVRFALDDFGTGYSSLTYLKRLPADRLKIDQSFVRDMLEDQNDLAIVKGIIGLASAFHREVIAEGVESIQHGQLLLSIGCEMAQGYCIAKPMPANSLPQWSASWQAPSSWRIDQP